MRAQRQRTLHIKDPAAYELAEKLSKQLGVSLAEAVVRAMEEYYRKLPKPTDWKKIDALRAEARALPILDSRTDDEIIGYDEFGVPR